VAIERSSTGLKLLVSPPPEEDGGSLALQYVVQVQKVPSHKWVNHGVYVPSRYTASMRRDLHVIDVDGLAATERYAVRVSAMNAAGQFGPPSTECVHKPAQLIDDRMSSSCCRTCS